MELDDSRFFSNCLLFLYIAGPLTVLSLRFTSAPYGRHLRPGWGPTLPSPIAWFLMESPTLLLLPLLLPLRRLASPPLPLALFLLHYLHRTLLYPLRLHKGRVPFSVVSMGFLFNVLNTYLQTRSATRYTDYTNQRWMYFRSVIGVAVFLYGMYVNVGSDRELVRLKKESGGVYVIPRGGWFEVVASPNYMGEAVEWLGYAVVAWSPAAFGFFLYTCANLGPRAAVHLEWYRNKFGAEYPANRKAFVPFVY